VLTYPKTGPQDLLRLSRLLLTARARRRDVAEAVAGWLRDVVQRHGSPNVIIDLIVRRILLVSGPELSSHILAGAPSSQGYVEGTARRKAVSFLCPHALTIAHDREWRDLRAFNEELLEIRHRPDDLQAMLAQVKKAFDGGIQGIDDVRRRMGRVMLAWIFGEGNAPVHLIDDIQELFAELSLRTAVLGSRKTELRDRFMGEIRALWDRAAASAEPTLLARAHNVAENAGISRADENVLVEQIPHWMFTFTNSGSDLLARTLAMIVARPECLAGVRQEIDSVGGLNTPDDVNRLQYLEACIFETGRLYPPVVQTAHRAARADIFNAHEIPADTEILQYFPLTNRNVDHDALADHFRPERWLDGRDSVHKLAPNLFLSGARACPGRNLILFVEKAAIATLLCDGAMQPRTNVLSKDPLPFSFPSDCLCF
jgi:cytochrome P450